MKIIAVFGLPGTGKSYLSEHISNILDARYLSSDIIRMKIFPEKRTYSKEEKRIVYFTILEEIKDYVKNDKDVVIDATFSSSLFREQVDALAKNYNTEVIWIETLAEESLIEERLSKKRENSEADLEVYTKLKNEFDPMEKSHIRFHSGKDDINDFIDVLTRKISA